MEQRGGLRLWHPLRNQLLFTTSLMLNLRACTLARLHAVVLHHVVLTLLTLALPFYTADSRDARIYVCWR